MPRFVVAFLLLLAGLSSPASAAPAEGLPTRPVPFTFVTDQGNLLAPADAKKLEGGLRKYAEATGTQVVVVTVPSLNGTDVADYGRQLGAAWGVGQRAKNNGVVVLLAAKEHKVTIQAGSGLKDAVTPELTSRIINQEMTPAFKQGNYFAGLREGLNTLMLAANPDSDPRKSQAAAATPPVSAASGSPAATPGASLNDQATTTSTSSNSDPAGAQSGGLGNMSGSAVIRTMGIGTLLVGALLVFGGIWLVRKLLSRNSAVASQGQSPNFMGRSNSPTPNFGAPNAGYQQGGPGYGAAPSGGSGMGGLLATGAAAAAGAYLGNRMSQGHESNTAGQNFDGNAAAGLGGAGAAAAGTGAAAAGTGAAGDYFSSRGGDASPNAEPDYFSGDNSADSSGDYFSSDNSSYDDTSSDDTGGGGFDSPDDNSGSW